jgi:hypothetical protein
MKGDAAGLRRSLAERRVASVCRSVSTKREKDVMQTLSKSWEIRQRKLLDGTR